VQGRGTPLRLPLRPPGRVVEGIAGPSDSQFSEALGRPITCVDVPFQQWAEDLRRLELPSHAMHHVANMARLHRDNRYDRLTDDVRKVTGIEAFVRDNPGLFRPSEEFAAVSETQRRPRTERRG
jgi:hypothetical protein